MSLFKYKTTTQVQTTEVEVVIHVHPGWPTPAHLRFNLDRVVAILQHKERRFHPAAVTPPHVLASPCLALAMQPDAIRTGRHCGHCRSTTEPATVEGRQQKSTDQSLTPHPPPLPGGRPRGAVLHFACSAWARRFATAARYSWCGPGHQLFPAHQGPCGRLVNFQGKNRLRRLKQHLGPVRKGRHRRPRAAVYTQSPHKPHQVRAEAATLPVWLVAGITRKEPSCPRDTHHAG
jgi:hypothetical protein